MRIHVGLTGQIEPSSLYSEYSRLSLQRLNARTALCPQIRMYLKLAYSNSAS